FKSLVRSVFTHGAIETTSAKARSVISIIEKLSNHIITKDVILAQRELSTYIQDKLLVSQIYHSFKAVFEGQTSNFTKMIKVKIRQGDDALIVKLTFVKPYKVAVKEKAEVVKEVKKVKAVKKLSVAKSARGGKVAKK
ncbi:MAG: L17 family ribosomal protein, partial [archaeon]